MQIMCGCVDAIDQLLMFSSFCLLKLLGFQFQFPFQIMTKLWLLLCDVWSWKNELCWILQPIHSYLQKSEDSLFGPLILYTVLSIKLLGFQFQFPFQIMTKLWLLLCDVWSWKNELCWILQPIHSYLQKSEDSLFGPLILYTVLSILS